METTVDNGEERGCAPERLYAGVDGGGSGTRLVARLGARRVETSAGPAGLGLGVEGAWSQILEALERARALLGDAPPLARCHLGLGLAGANQRRWHDAFLAAAPDVASLRLETDAFTTLLGAHGGAPGVVVALGTGSVGEALWYNGACRSVGGYGFPAGDQASGAWLGLRASAHLQRALDGRAAPDAFSRALAEAMAAADGGAGSETAAPPDTPAALIEWLSGANQTRFAALAPVVVGFADHPVARALLVEAGEEVTGMVQALDPSATLPVALCGGLAGALAPWLPAPLTARLIVPRAPSVEGALLLAEGSAP